METVEPPLVNDACWSSFAWNTQRDVNRFIPVLFSPQCSGKLGGDHGERGYKETGGKEGMGTCSRNEKLKKKKKYAVQDKDCE